MKQIIIDYLKTDRGFESGVELFKKFGTSLSFKLVLSRQGYSDYNHSLLHEELRKIAGLSTPEFETIMRRQLAPKSIISVKDAEPVSSEEKTVFIREIPEQIRKTIRLRDDFPFLDSPDCPQEFKILVHDMLTAYGQYVEGHKRLFEATTGEELQEIAASVVENYIENREIWDELNYYKATGQILGKHPIFSQTDRLKEIQGMTTAEQVKLQKNLMNNIARTKQKITEQPDHENTTERKQSVAKFEVELQEVNRILGLDA